ncbi:MAG: DHH family phosphoesterase [Oscillospiraceae bacterium]|nr:DHH family phosphoesterase [Oscillospiraceae bacterium]
MNKKLRALVDINAGVYLITMSCFVAATFVLGYFVLSGTRAGYLLELLSGAEAVAVLVLLVVYSVTTKNRQKNLESYIETVMYDSENARSRTLMNFPLPIAVFQLDDTRIVWANDEFFRICGSKGTRYDARMVDFLPEFDSKWLSEGQSQYPTLLQLNGRRYRVHGNLIRHDFEDENVTFMGITYWLDVTEYDDIRIEYEESRPVAGVILIDNYEELIKNQPDKERNRMRDSIEEKLMNWAEGTKGFVRRLDRDRYLVLMEKRELASMKEQKFPIVETIHSVESAAGISASVSLGFGEDASSFSEALQFADMAAELAISRGGDQVVIKNRLNFEFFGGRGGEIERRTKVKSRVMATTLQSLVKDSSKVYVMGHRFSDLDAIGAAVGVCCVCRLSGIRYHIVVDENTTAAKPLIDKLKTVPEYRSVFVTPQEAVLHADGRTLLVVVDTNRPEQVEEQDLLDACNRVAVIDHHRVAATYIHNAALGFIEPYASSACELLTEIIQELAPDINSVLKCEAEALLSGIVLDTKNFTIRTGERTFDAGAYLRRAGADTAEVKKLLQSDLEDTLAKYRILQGAQIYKGVAIAVPSEVTGRIIAAKAADELLNISGVEASIVIAPAPGGGCIASARSIGEMNMQIIMEKLGGGGNRSAAAAQLKDVDAPAARDMVLKAIDEYLG